MVKKIYVKNLHNFLVTSGPVAGESWDYEISFRRGVVRLSVSNHAKKVDVMGEPRRKLMAGIWGKFDRYD